MTNVTTQEEGTVEEEGKEVRYGLAWIYHVQ